MKSLYKYVIYLFFLALCNAACKKSDPINQTITLLGTESYVTPVVEIIPDSLRPTVPSLFGGFSEGYCPPNLEGEYTINKQFCHSNFIVDLSDSQDMHLRITNQHNRVACVDFYEGFTVHKDTAYIMGEGNFFTLYFVEDRNMAFNGYHSIAKRCVIITGEKTVEGINNLHYGNVILDAEKGDTPYLGFYAKGWYFVYKDGDGVSYNDNWFDQHGEEE